MKVEREEKNTQTFSYHADVFPKKNSDCHIHCLKEKWRQNDVYQ